MTDQLLKPLWPITAGVLAFVVAVSLPWGVRGALGVLAGGAWNLASLWCLTRLLSAWLGPRRSNRRVVGWFLIKFPLLYFSAFALLNQPAVSVVGFTVGFTVVLMSAIVFFVTRVQRALTPVTHER